ncbi:flagellar hook assembly protein FlgD [Candidatus Sodalis endolongispinus]|uniref:Basal-body rod modification protein FlgD n=1 Tax=Candidatus Sodalis endolongispinus TaxID=2812662 RepID=A0ABS5Y969_9GAMM|nr:flagellar hook assembly protein FlgD [Candidatus Sodalis endolongispinus]MBT9431204.1 flagellar hook assembly protein FlgD [Candidatus Sodalis endolongispinus]
MSLAVNLNETASSASAASATSSSGSESSADLQNNFLTLLVAQLRNQDPTNPLDNAELTTQLAQISTLSGIENLNTTLGSISSQLTTSQNLQATTLVGHGVMIDGDTILVGSDSSTTPFGVELDAAASDVVVTIQDASGNTVKTVNLGSQTAGAHAYSWDGTDDAGTAVAEGSYSFSVSSSTTTATALKYAEVYGVSNSNGTTQLNLGLSGNVTLDKIKQII